MPRLMHQARFFCFVPILIGCSFTSLAQNPEWLFSFPEVTRVSRLSVDPVQPTTLYATASTVTSATLYKSTDAGITWTKSQSPGGSIGVMAFDRHRPSYVYIGGVGEVHKSTDGGATWTRIDLEAPGTDRPRTVLALTVDPSDSETLYAGLSGSFIGDSWNPTPIHGAVLKSTDGGLTWANSSQGIAFSGWLPVDVRDIEINPADSRDLYVATRDGLYNSTDRGANWMLVSSLPWMPETTILRADPRSWQVLYLAQNRPPAVSKSTDGGKTWRPITRGLQNHEILSLVLDLKDPDTLYASCRQRDDGGDIFVTVNAGESWNRIDPNLPREVSSLALGGSGFSTLYAATDVGVMRVRVPRQDRFYFPQIGAGSDGGWELRTELTLANMGPEARVRVDFFDPSGQPLALAFGERQPSSSLQLVLESGEVFSETSRSFGFLVTGYAVVNAPPDVSGNLVFSCTREGNILYEVGVPAIRAPNRNFTVYIDTPNRQSDIGLALVNAGSLEANVDLALYDANYKLIASRSLATITGHPLRPGEQLAIYVTELFADIGKLEVQTATIAVESDQDLAAITLHQTADASGLRMSSFPVIPRRANQGTPALGRYQCFLPHVADGKLGTDTVNTEFVFVNTGDDATIHFRFTGPNGKLDLELEELGKGSEFTLSLARGQARVIRTKGQGPLQSGSAVFWGTEVGVLAFIAHSNQASATEVAVQVPAPVQKLSFVFDTRDPTVDTGLGVYTAGDNTVLTNLILRLYDNNGVLVATRPTQWIPWIHQAFFATELFPEIRAQGIKRGLISIDSDQVIAAIILRQHFVRAAGALENACRLTTLPVLTRILE